MSRLAVLVLAAAAAAVALGAAGEAYAHTNPGDEFNIRGDPIDSGADHGGHLLLDTITNGIEARFMWVNHVGTASYWSIWDYADLSRGYGRIYYLGWDEQSDGFATIQRSDGSVINTAALMRNRSTYVMVGTGWNVPYIELPFSTTSATSGTEYHIPLIEIVGTTNTSVTFNATFKHPGMHHFGVSTTGNASDASTAATVTTLTSAGPGDTQTGTITGLSAGTTYYIHGSNGDKAVNSADSSRSTESFTAQEPPILTPTASYRGSFELASPRSIAPNSQHIPSQWIRSAIEVPASLTSPISKATVFLDAESGSQISLAAELTSPAGTEVDVVGDFGYADRYSPRVFATNADLAGRPLEAMLGESPAGTWALAVYDKLISTGTFTGWWLEVEYELPGRAAGRPHDNAESGAREASVTVSHDAADAVTVQTVGAYGGPYDVRVIAPNRTVIHEASGLANNEIIEASIAGLAEPGAYIVQTDAADAAAKWETDTSVVATFEHPHATHEAQYVPNLDPIIDSAGLRDSYYALAGRELAINHTGIDYDSPPGDAPGDAPRLHWLIDASSHPAGGDANEATLGPRDGMFAWTPAAANVGEHEVRILLRDANPDDEGEDSHAFAITVHDAISMDPAPQTAVEGMLLNYTVPLNASGVDHFTWAITSGAEGDAVIGGPTGQFTWTPALGDARPEPYEFGLRAEVGNLDRPGNSHAEGTLSVTVEAAPVTLTPADDPVADPVPYETSVNIDVVGNDAITPAGTAVMITLVQPANGMVVAHDNNGTVTYTPAAGHSGSDSFTYTLSQADGSGSPSAPATVTLTVAQPADPGPPNRPPAIAAIGNQTAAVGAPLQVTFTVSDPDGDALTVGLGGVDALAGATFDAASRILDWPAPAAGSYGLNLTARDDTETVYEFFWLIVGAANMPPTFDGPVGDQAAIAGDLVRVDANATDPEGGTVTYALGGDALPGHTFGAADGILEWTPQAAGTYGVTITATDPEGASAPLSFTITVAPAGDVRQGMSAADIAGVIDGAPSGGVVTFGPGTYGDRGAILITKPLTLEPVGAAPPVGLAAEQGAAVVFAGDTSLHVRSDGVTIRGFEFRGVTAPEAIRVSSTAGLTVSDNAFHDSMSGVVVADTATVIDYAALALSDDTCLVGAEACAPRTGAGSRLAAAPVSSSALVTDNTFSGMAHYTVANLAAGSLNADRNHHGAGGAAFGGVIVEPWYEDPRRTEPGVLGTTAVGQPGALVRVPDPGSECTPGISSQALDLGSALWGNASAASVQEVRAAGNRDITEVTVRTTQWAGSGGSYPYSEAVTEARAAGTGWLSTAAPGGATFELDDALEWDDPTDVLRIELRLSLPKQAGPGDGLSQSMEYSATCR